MQAAREGTKADAAHFGYLNILRAYLINEKLTVFMSSWNTPRMGWETFCSYQAGRSPARDWWIPRARAEVRSAADQSGASSFPP